MGRNSTGAMTVNSSHRIEINDLIKWGYFKYIGSHSRTMVWNDGSEITIHIHNQPEDCSLMLDYNLTDSYGEKHLLIYRIDIEKIPSNLGKGSILYFNCPETGKRCKILYRTYHCHKFKSREAYRHRIYYPVQISSKRYAPLERYQLAEKKFEKLIASRKRHQKTFKGKRTKFNIKLQAMENRVKMLDDISTRSFLLWAAL